MCVCTHVCIPCPTQFPFIIATPSYCTPSPGLAPVPSPYHSQCDLSKCTPDQACLPLKSLQRPADSMKVMLFKQGSRLSTSPGSWISTLRHHSTAGASLHFSSLLCLDSFAHFHLLISPKGPSPSKLPAGLSAGTTLYPVCGFAVSSQDHKLLGDGGRTVFIYTSKVENWAWHMG